MDDTHVDHAFNMTDVDDLFGDSEPVPLPNLTIPPLKGLPQRLSELSVSACCQ